MDTSRRDFLTIGAAGVVAAVATQAAAAEAGGQEPTGATRALDIGRRYEL